MSQQFTQPEPTPISTPDAQSVTRNALKLAVEALEKITHTVCYDPGAGGCIGENKCPRCTAKETLFDIRKLE